MRNSMTGWWTLRWVSWSGYEANLYCRRFSDHRRSTYLRQRQPRTGFFNWLAASPNGRLDVKSKFDHVAIRQGAMRDQQLSGRRPLALGSSLGSEATWWRLAARRIMRLRRRRTSPAAPAIPRVDRPSTPSPRSRSDSNTY